MSTRKQRRFENKKAANNSPSKSTASQKAEAEYYKNLGISLKAAGQETQAVEPLCKALEMDSSLADVHFALAMMALNKPQLGIDIEKINHLIKRKAEIKDAYAHIIFILKKKKQYSEALLCQSEMCKLFPKDLDEKANLGLLLNLQGNKKDSLRIFAELMEADPSNKNYKAIFFTACANTALTKFEPSIKRALQVCFDNIYEANLLKVYTPWISTVQHDPNCSDIKEAEKLVTEDDFKAWIESRDRNINFLREKFFLDGIRLLIIPDPILEIFLIRMRRWLCLNFKKMKGDRLRFFEPFLLALAEQCFFNEYIYMCNEREEFIVNEIIEDFKKGIRTLDSSQTKALALIGCYQSMFEIFPREEQKFKKISDEYPTFFNLAKTQYFDPLKEQEIKKDIKELGVSENQVSKNVQAQYEEHPYPRWISIINYSMPTDTLPISEQDRKKPWKVLVAGCGTGRQAIGTAATYPNGKITAIDLSCASLAYAKRKSIEAKIANRIDFIHADILEMEKWPEPFDIIECSGVMHHMEDPFKGWKILTDLLKPGGFFKVGLYSESARKYYVEAQNFAKDKGFPPTLDGIRKFRNEILLLPTNTPMRNRVTSSADFYTTSLVRDLIFHVQEHRMTLPQIKEMMDKLGLSCTGFIINDVDTIKKYDQLFPTDLERKNIENWHEFEQKFPETFMGMYQFWCRKN